MTNDFLKCLCIQFRRQNNAAKLNELLSKFGVKNLGDLDDLLPDARQKLETALLNALPSAAIKWAKEHAEGSAQAKIAPPAQTLDVAGIWARWNAIGGSRRWTR